MQKGKASKSYGIAVARLAGLPQVVIERAKDVLSKLEQYELAVFADERSTGVAAAVGKKIATQHSLFAISNESVIEKLRQIDPAKMAAEDVKELLIQVQRDII
jgi:DNA mismatch repair protein MutS